MLHLQQNSVLLGAATTCSWNLQFIAPDSQSSCIVGCSDIGACGLYALLSVFSSSLNPDSGANSCLTRGQVPQISKFCKSLMGSFGI